MNMTTLNIAKRAYYGVADADNYPKLRDMIIAHGKCREIELIVSDIEKAIDATIAKASDEMAEAILDAMTGRGPYKEEGKEPYRDYEGVVQDAINEVCEELIGLRYYDSHQQAEKLGRLALRLSTYEYELHDCGFTFAIKIVEGARKLIVIDSDVCAMCPPASCGIGGDLDEAPDSEEWSGGMLSLAIPKKYHPERWYTGHLMPIDPLGNIEFSPNWAKRSRGTGDAK